MGNHFDSGLRHGTHTNHAKYAGTDLTTTKIDQILYIPLAVI